MKCPNCHSNIKIMTPPMTKDGTQVCCELCRKEYDGEISHAQFKRMMFNAGK